MSAAIFNSKSLKSPNGCEQNQYSSQIRIQPNAFSSGLVNCRRSCGHSYHNVANKATDYTWSGNISIACMCCRFVLYHHRSYSNKTGNFLESRIMRKSKFSSGLSLKRSLKLLSEIYQRLGSALKGIRTFLSVYETISSFEKQTDRIFFSD